MSSIFLKATLYQWLLLFIVSVRETQSAIEVSMAPSVRESVSSGTP